MSDKNMADVADKAVDKLAEVEVETGRMKTGVCESAVRSERVEGIVNVTLLLAGCVLATLASRKALSEMAEFRKHDRDATGFAVWCVVAGCALLFAVIAMIGNAGDEISRAVSPEYYAA